jgi:hypothetical protein
LKCQKVKFQDLIVVSPSKDLKVERQMMEMEEEGINYVKMFVIITLASNSGDHSL